MFAEHGLRECESSVNFSYRAFLQTHWELCHGIDSHKSAHAHILCLPVWRRTNLGIRLRDDADVTAVNRQNISAI
jgi:hypothetical protein